jgi:hypothetical protein
MELLHLLAEFAGRYLDFEPTSPLQGVESPLGYHGLIDSIKAIKDGGTLWRPSPKVPITSETNCSDKGNVLLLLWVLFHNFFCKDRQ